MPAKRTPLPPVPNPRQLVGIAVRDLIAWRGMTITSAGQSSHNCARPTIQRILRGDPTVSDVPLQSIAGTLGLPVNTFLLMLDQDVKAIAKLTMEAYPREHILNLLDTSQAIPRRRAADS